MIDDISSEKNKEKMKELIELLKKWNYEYFILNNPSISDFAYDEKMRELYELEKKNNFSFEDSPTKNVGHGLNYENYTEKRKRKMLSLESVNDYSLVINFDKKIKKILKEDKINYVSEWKIDGLSISLIYKNHILSKVNTRGDGVVGEDVTNNKWMIKNIPFFLKNILNCEIRGEVYMKKNNFECLNFNLLKKKEKLMANPRNAASGSLRNSDYSEDRILNFFAYQIFFDESDGNNFEVKDQFNCLKYLKKSGFSISPDCELFENIEDVLKNIEEKQSKRGFLDFESDGVVIKINNYEYYNILGENNKFPKWAIAYKFPSHFSKSYLENIEVNLSRSGRINYIAKIKPVKIQGSIINKVSLHNFNFIKRMKININDEIIVKKAGDVIPQILEIIKKNNDENYWIPPEKCPFCSSDLIWDKKENYQLCINNYCEERDIKSIVHFLSKEGGLNVKWISRNIVKKLYDEKIIKYPSDLFLLSEKKEEIIKLEGFKEKKINRIIESIELAKKMPIYSLISALGIPMLGSIKAKKMFDFLSLSKILEIIEKKEWNKIEDILGKKTSENFENYFLINNNKISFKKLIEFYIN